mmetsp:Transcript_3584/g.7014  ORF Transcript_3584/g.7014 Transcript_3584/m.7014 type:complete len:226 (+) Transcript_3584:134-811(+)
MSLGSTAPQFNCDGSSGALPCGTPASNVVPVTVYLVVAAAAHNAAAAAQHSTAELHPNGRRSSMVSSWHGKKRVWRSAPDVGRLSLRGQPQRNNDIGVNGVASLVLQLRPGLQLRTGLPPCRERLRSTARCHDCSPPRAGSTAPRHHSPSGQQERTSIHTSDRFFGNSNEKGILKRCAALSSKSCRALADAASCRAHHGHHLVHGPCQPLHAEPIVVWILAGALA